MVRVKQKNRWAPGHLSGIVKLADLLPEQSWSPRKIGLVSLPLAKVETQSYLKGQETIILWIPISCLYVFQRLEFILLSKDRIGDIIQVHCVYTDRAYYLIETRK